MKTNEQLLLKHFASVLRNKANGKQEPISPTLLKYLSRKDLVEVIKKIHNGTLPRNLELALMENEELLDIIKDEMFVIAFVTEKWSKEQVDKILPHGKEQLLKKMDTSISKAVDNENKSNKSSIIKNKKDNK